MENKYNAKETINLLDLLSESDSDLSDIIEIQKKKKVKRRQKFVNERVKKNNNTCNCIKSQTKIITLWFATLFIIFWLIALSWLAIILYGEIGKMDTTIKTVIAGSDGVQDTLQKCHSLSKELQNNQTFLYTQLADVKLQIANFTTQLSSLQPELHQVQELLNRAPELTNVPKDLNNILNSVATFGSKIEDLKSTADGLKIVDQKLQDAQNIIQNNITEIKTSLTELSHITRGPELLTNASKIKTDELSQAISKLQIDLTNITETLTKKLTWLQNDRENDKKKLDSMMDNNLNVTVTLESLRGQCAKISEHEKLLNATIMTVNDQVKNIHTLDLNARINKMEQNYSHLKNTTDVILNSINDINNNSKVSGQGQTTRNTTQS
ncbi:hypothetical protein HCN44_001773 [Aphidius gifuensis]|uniref:Uncharacterized protein n=1 Tax=Aphidius gifuensis TaxID=684658 RepID=A0A835CSN6_APHGI|nr:hypothetical protein HCN44_001773 [Aphidius gifuensis]